MLQERRARRAPARALGIVAALLAAACARAPAPPARTVAPHPPTVRAAGDAVAAVALPSGGVTATVVDEQAGAPERFDDGLRADPNAPAHGVAQPPAPSLSVGSPQEGSLQDGVRLPVGVALGLEALPHTLRRDWLWGTFELVSLLRSAARNLALAGEGEGGAVPPLRIGNLSRHGGGNIAPSRSHNSGRDVDISFFHLDREHRAIDLPHMVRYDDRGVAAAPRSVAGAVFFDPARNWALVRHLLSDPSVVVQWIFIAAPLRNILLDYALRIGEPEAMRLRAMRVMVQPTDSSPHADHFHVRIACPPDDRPQCIDGAGRTREAREAQIDALLHLYHHGSPSEQRYAREILSLPRGGVDLELPPTGEGDAEAHDAMQAHDDEEDVHDASKKEQR